MIVSLLNGEAILIIQTRIEDARFDDLDVIPVGADKAFIRSLSNSDIMAVFAKAQDFFNLFFTKLVPWNKDILKFERGAWVRIYVHLSTLGAKHFLNCVCLIAADFYGWTMVLFRRKRLVMLVF